MTDAFLLKRARRGDQVAVDHLYDRSGHVLAVEASKFYLSGAERQDVHQEARIAFFKAIGDFNAVAGVEFHVFARICVRRHLVSALKASQRQKAKPLSEAVRVAITDEGEAEAIVDRIQAGDSWDPHRTVCREQDEVRVLYAVDFGLSELEREAMCGLIDGLTYGQLASTLGCSAKAIDNAIQRARRILRQLVPDALEEAA